MATSGERRPPGVVRTVERELRCGFWRWNLVTDRMMWSKGYFDLLGLDSGGVAPSFAAMLRATHPDDRAAHADIRRILRSASSVKRRFRVVRPGGVIAWLSCHILVFVDESGVAEKALGVCSDATAQAERLKAMRLADERLRALAAAIGPHAWIARADGAMHDLSRATSTDPAGDWLARVHPDDRAATLEAWRAARETMAAFSCHHRLRQENGRYRWRHSRAEPVFDENGVAEWIGVHADPQPDDEEADRQRITGAQIRAARGLLKWSVSDLAQASGVAPGTIRRLEESDGAPRAVEPALTPIKSAFEQAGVELLFPGFGKPGVRPV